MLLTRFCGIRRLLQGEDCCILIMKTLALLFSNADWAESSFVDNLLHESKNESVISRSSRESVYQAMACTIVN